LSIFSSSMLTVARIAQFLGWANAHAAGNAAANQWPYGANRQWNQPRSER
jgi:hypothetical protein